MANGDKLLAESFDYSFNSLQEKSQLMEGNAALRTFHDEIKLFTHDWALLSLTI